MLDSMYSYTDFINSGTLFHVEQVAKVINFYWLNGVIIKNVSLCGTI
jgi:hypothetical protein